MEALNALLQRLAKAGLFLAEHGPDGLLGGQQLGEEGAHVVAHHVHQLGEEALLRAQHFRAVAHRTAEHAAEHVVAAEVARARAIGDGEAQRADVVCHHAVRHVLAVHVVLPDLVSVRAGASHLGDLIKDGGKDVGRVVGALVLQHADHALHAHAGVHVLVRQRLEAAVCLAVELNEDNIPDLQNIGVIHVHQVRSVAAADAIVVDLCAGAAGALVSHLPKVVLAVKGKHTPGRQVLEPDLPGLFVCVKPLGRIATKVRGVDSGGIHLKHLGQQLPRPSDGLLLEVVAEAPVAQHLEKGMMVHVLAHVVKVIVLAACADALLGVGGGLELGELCCGVGGTQENGLELVHARIGEEQGGVVVRHHG
mmetsp:Transcript_11487/g.29021  ORF Transcript_11487/g.29021 Transcript_11487/m.29021 type:complete len:365 (+) Transcript_11487:1812-2906(+)